MDVIYWRGRNDRIEELVIKVGEQIALQILNNERRHFYIIPNLALDVETSNFWRTIISQISFLDLPVCVTTTSIRNDE